MANLGPMQAFYSANLESVPDGALCPPCCSAWIMAVGQALRAANLSSKCSTSMSGDEAPFAITPPPGVSQKWEKDNRRRILLPSSVLHTTAQIFLCFAVSN